MASTQRLEPWDDVRRRPPSGARVFQLLQQASILKQENTDNKYTASY